MALPKRKVRELLFPSAGVQRRQTQEGTERFAAPYPTSWAANVFPEDAIAHRLRGGSRPGLTKYLAGTVGTTVATMLSVPCASASGATSKLAIIVDGTLGVVDEDALTSPTGEFTTEAGVTITTEAGANILAGTGGVPSTCVLCSRGSKVYGITSTGISVMDIYTGVVDSLTATKGTVPTGVTHGCVWRDRLVLAGADNSVYISRQGDFTDWDFGAVREDSGRAMVFQLSESNEIGDICTALVPFKDSTLLAATRYGIWIVRGDPAASGTLHNVTRGIGIIRASAWCRVDDAQVGDMVVRYGILFLGENGLYVISPSGEGLESVSGDRLPEELQSIAATTVVSMVYAPKQRGVYVFLTPSTGTGTHWFISTVNKGFWPVFHQEDHQPLAACWHEGDVLLAGQDGYLRSIGGDDDDSEDIESHLLIGPLRLGGPNIFGLLTSLHGMVAASSGTVNWRIVTGTTAENACDRAKTAIGLYQAGSIASALAYVSASGSWEAGRSMTKYPRVRAMWMVLWLQSTDQWAYESSVVESTEAGRWR